MTSAGTLVCHDGAMSQADGAGVSSPGVGSWPPLPERLPVDVPDSHCHLDIAYDPDKHGPGLDVADALAWSARVGVTRVVQVGYDLDSSRFGVDVARAHPQVVAAVALHPNEAPRLAAAGDYDEHMAAIEVLAQDPRVRAVGETGLDHYRTGPEGRTAQEESFRRHIELAKRLDRTLVIHDRDAHDDVVRVLVDEGPPDRVVFHCFSGGPDLARTCADHGWFMSFAGTVTFKANEHLREALVAAPVDLVLVETDAPFLAPLPHRGRPNASYLVPVTLATMADVRGTDLAELCQTVSANTDRAFGAW